MRIEDLFSNKHHSAIMLLSSVIVLLSACAANPVQRPSTAQRLGPLPFDLNTRLQSAAWNRYVGNALGIWVCVETQQILLIQNDLILKIYPCSTAAAGTGNINGSNQTPTGWHEIGAKIGANLPAGAVLKERCWTGEVWQDGQASEEDLILSRVLWLRGLEQDHNLGGPVDTWNRYIYIHGTNHVDRLGQPASHGCVRLANKHVIDLFEKVEVGCRVFISE